MYFWFLLWFNIRIILIQQTEKAMATHSSTLAWKIPWAEEPGRLQSMGLRRVGHDWGTSLSLFTFMHWRRKWQPSLAWRIPGMGELGGLPSMGSHRVGHDWSDLAAAAAAAAIQQNSKFVFIIVALFYGINVLRLICIKMLINNIHSVF